MTELGFVFEEYRAAIEHMGATDAAIIAAPPSDLEFARLADYLDGHVPDQLIEWFQLCNGPIPATGGRDALMLFPWWYSYSLSFLLDNVERLARRFDQIEEGPIPQRPFPVLLDDRQTGGMWIECARSDGRLVYCDELEFCGTHDGYYHDSLDAFVGGCLTNLRAGQYEVRYGGIATPPVATPVLDPFRAPVDFVAAGFQKEKGLPPRLPWPTSDYDGIDVTAPTRDA